MDLNSLLQYFLTAAGILLHSGSNNEGRTTAAASCGISARSATHPISRIVGGKPVYDGQLPWQVSLQRRLITGWGHYCGGSVISSQWILTAAHCVQGGMSPARVHAGFVSFTDPKASAYSQVRNVAKAIPHPQFDSQSLDNDIALIQLDSPLDLSGSHGYVGPVCLPARKDANYAGETGLVSGWGSTSFQGSPSPQLLMAEVSIYSDSTCEKTYGREIRTSLTLCAGSLSGDTDSCQGDSGSPLTVKSVVSEGVTQVGIVSSGYNCAVKGFPGLYTKVSHYTDWIRSTTGI